MLGVELWDEAKGNSHMGKSHRVGASVYFGLMSSLKLAPIGHSDKRFLLISEYDSDHWLISVYQHYSVISIQESDSDTGPLILWLIAH